MYFCSQPTVGADGNVYFAHPTHDYTQGGVVEFGVGSSGPNNTMVWSQLVDSRSQPIFVRVRQSNRDHLPVPGAPVCGLVPYLVGDPTTPDRLFLVYNDYPPAPDDTSDMNVYCVTLENNANVWSTFSPVRVNDDPVISPPRPDQVIPAAAVDARGRLHVIFYDNRSTCPGGSCASISFDEYYAISTDHGATFANYTLTGSGQNPAVDSTGWDPREDNGIAMYNGASAAEIWTSYSGRNGGGPAIFGSHIAVTF